MAKLRNIFDLLPIRDKRSADMVKLTTNRRISPDKWVVLSRLLAVLSWFGFIAALILSYYAAPDDSYGLLLSKNIPTRDHWLQPLTNYLYLILWLSAVLSFISLSLTKFRSRRHDDSKQFNLILLIITITAWIIYIITHSN